MNESLNTHDREPLSNAEQAQNLYRAVIQNQQSNSPSHGFFTGELTWANQTQNGETQTIRLFPSDDAGFRDHNHADPYRRIIASVTDMVGHEFTIWNKNVSPESDETDLELLVCREISPELKSEIQKAKMGSVVEKVVNHLTTYGAFIGGVEAERRQRLSNTIQQLKEASGVVEKPTNDEVDRLIDNFNS